MVKYIVKVVDREIPVEIRESGLDFQISVDGRTHKSSAVFNQSHNQLSLLLGSRSFDADILRTNGATSVFLSGREFNCVVEDERLASLEKVAGIKHSPHGTELRAPMPGLVVKILKAVGDQVVKGERLIIIEAMKMENELKSQATGVIKDIRARLGKPVDKGDVLVVFE